MCEFDNILYLKCSAEKNLSGISKLKTLKPIPRIDNNSVLMGAAQAGSLNTAGFSSCIASGMIPKSDHITYAGSFNEIYFNVGEKTPKLLDLYCGFSVSNPPIKFDFLDKKSYFLSLFLKSNKDGTPRTRKIHACLVLDISGSMDSPINYRGEVNERSRLQLARQAIKLFYKKLNPDDVFSFVVFHQDAKTIIPSSYVRDLQEASVFQSIDKNHGSGGTTLKNGYIEAEKNFKSFPDTVKGGYQRRIVMLTDVGDNSAETQKQFTAKLSSSGIHTTIVGISQDFRSSTCQGLIKTKGFNYFCATEDSHLKEHLYDHFDYTFFPAIYKVNITLQTQQVLDIDVFGTPDFKQRAGYQSQQLKNQGEFPITKMQSVFPSDFTSDKNGKPVTQGGLMLVKITPKDSLSDHFQGVLKLDYLTLEGQKVEEIISLNYPLSLDQYHTEQTMEKGVRAFYYTYCLKRIIDRMNSNEQGLSDETYQMYLQNLSSLTSITPQNKKQQLEGLVKLVNQYKNRPKV